ncbi:MAG: hypothetical protein KF851_17120 [Pirellulaceae bacterium]|nr:hypothetical protein [Pirellulaceae bacterium]
MRTDDLQSKHGRRHFLRFLTGGLTLALPGWALARNGLWMPDEELPITPTQIEGPFYPQPSIDQQLFNDTDLVQRAAGHEFAKGEQIIVNGVVKNRKGQPLPGSVVEIWQACATGRYHHPRDENNPALLDNNFQFWGRAITGEDGSYSFKSIIPGMYTGRTARHIHFRIDSPGLKRLTTQCYFSDFGEDNARDGLYRSLQPNERKLVTVELDSAEAAKLNTDAATQGQTIEQDRTPRSGKFDIVLG